MEIEREFVERLKANPANIARQLVALTEISDWARVMHRDNFDGYLIAASELLTSPTADLCDDLVAMIVKWEDSMETPADLARNIIERFDQARPTADLGEDGELVGRALRYRKENLPQRTVGFALIGELADRIERLRKALEGMVRIADWGAEDSEEYAQARALLSRSGDD